MKTLLTTLGLGLLLTATAVAQDNGQKQDTVKTKKEKTYNPKSNSKHNPNRKFGKERAATVQEQNGQMVKKSDNDFDKTEVKENKKVKNKQKNKDKKPKKEKTETPIKKD